MLIHELAARSGVAPHTIRFYEKAGLLDDSLTYRGANNYRHYHEDAVERLRMIRHGQAAGFTLAEMRELISAWVSGTLTLDEKQAVVRNKIAQVEARMSELARMRHYLIEKLPLLGVDDLEALMRSTPSAATSTPPAGSHPDR